MPALLWRAGHRVQRGLLDVLYPPRCLACQARLPSADPLCTACVTGLERARPEAIRERLGALPAADELFASTFALWRFDPDGALRTLQHALKYQNRPRYGRSVGRWMGAALADRLGPDVVDGVVAVPLHYTRRLERGYNQSAQLARGVAEHLGVPHRPGLLTRPRPTRSQTHLSRRARWENVHGAFAAPEPLEGRSLLLVDDVLTTGATVAAAAQVLLDNGAAGIHLATLALAE